MLAPCDPNIKRVLSEDVEASSERPRARCCELNTQGLNWFTLCWNFFHGMCKHPKNHVLRHYAIASRRRQSMTSQHKQIAYWHSGDRDNDRVLSEDVEASSERPRGRCCEFLHPVTPTSTECFRRMWKRPPNILVFDVASSAPKAWEWRELDWE